MKVSGTPLWDPSIGSPFAILNEPDLLARLPRLERRATVISGSIAAPYIRQVLDACGGTATVVGANKEIACLITIEDLAALTGDLPAGPVIIPGRAFVHDREAEEVLSGGGTLREVIRGPDCLTADAETSMGMSREEVLSLEMEGLSTLIQTINRYGWCT
jgi:NifB/MoaA-like Fe-S oxidoreductase